MKKLMFAVCAAALAAGAWAKETTPACAFDENQNWTPVAVSLWPGLEYPASDWSVTGLRFGLFAARHEDVLFLSASTLADLVTDNVNGLQVAGLCNHAGRSTGAVQMAGCVNSIGSDFAGVQVSGLYNSVSGTMSGLSVALLTKAETVDGLQVGIFNKAKVLNGVQVGVVNLAGESDGGIQLGVVNVMKDAAYPVMPVFNVGF